MTERERQTERKKERERETERDREKERERERQVIIHSIFASYVQNLIKVEN